MVVNRLIYSMLNFSANSCFHLHMQTRKRSYAFPTESMAGLTSNKAKR